MKIYFRNEEEKHHLQETYPDIKATYLPLPEESKELYDDVLVCRDEDPIEACFIGESHIERVAQLEQMRKEPIKTED